MSRCIRAQTPMESHLSLPLCIHIALALGGYWYRHTTRIRDTIELGSTDTVCTSIKKPLSPGSAQITGMSDVVLSNIRRGVLTLSCLMCGWQFTRNDEESSKLLCTHTFT
ncbi:unnamed protein product [Protopolystoma xenopodis]|uniref:Uncharacterized protein n=1 Tax=Protopolystoma xenopodis TaxID=117903 RepID=A0A448WIJ5_9PLAT|nr:unnamed protein product [Protopolystoma xenopodis]